MGTLGAWRPHMARRPGETREQRGDLLSWSCYRCGQEIRNRQKLNIHEEAHSRNHPPDVALLDWQSSAPQSHALSFEATDPASAMPDPTEHSAQKGRC